ncbi:MAG: hypothetical protein RL469_986 [Pseudomonadota bacterium]
MTRIPTHKELKARQRAERETHSDSAVLRVHRSLSWLERAEREKADPDARFIFLWIAFNAAYAIDSRGAALTESRTFQTFLRTLLKLDTRERIKHLIWETFSGSIRVLLENPYVFPDFWRHHNGELTANEWQANFRRARNLALVGLREDNRLLILSVVMTRLYTLRNQLIHGGATWDSQLNRDQVRDCSNLLGKLVPVIIEIMLDHPDHDWGPAIYPAVTAPVRPARNPRIPAVRS